MKLLYKMNSIATFNEGLSIDLCNLPSAYYIKVHAIIIMINCTVLLVQYVMYFN